MLEALIPQGFLDIEKERKLQYGWYHNFRSFLVEARGIEPLSENSSSRPSPSADAQLNFPCMHAERQACIIGIP